MDCKLVSYKRAYHSWCAFNHFSTSSKCLHYEKERTFSRVKKPISEERKAKETYARFLGGTMEGTYVNLNPLNTMLGF